MVILSFADLNGQAPVVQRTDNFIHRENSYPEDKMYFN